MAQELERPPAAPGPNDPASPDYALRHATRVTDFGNGRTQIDIGHPLAEVEPEGEPE